MAKITKETLEHLAGLCYLTLTKEEQTAFLPELEEVLGAFERLKKVDVGSETPRFQPIEIRNQWRADEPRECLSQEEAVQNAKHTEKGFIKGPRVIQ